MKKVQITLTQSDRQNLIEALHIQAYKVRDDRNRANIFAKKLLTLDEFIGQRMVTILVRVPDLQLSIRALARLAELDSNEKSILSPLIKKLNDIYMAEA